jgi:hypothetical protein
MFYPGSGSNNFLVSQKKITKYAKLLVSPQSEISRNGEFVSQNHETPFVLYLFREIRNETSFAGNPTCYRTKNARRAPFYIISAGNAVLMITVIILHDICDNNPNCSSSFTKVNVTIFYFLNGCHCSAPDNGHLFHDICDNNPNCSSSCT